MGLRGNQGRASCTGMRGGAFTVQSGTQRVWVCICAGGGRIMGHHDLPLAQRSHVRSLCCARGARLSHARACVACEGIPGVHQTDPRESCTVRRRSRGTRTPHARAHAHARQHTHAHAHAHAHAQHTLHRQALSCGPRLRVASAPPFAFLSAATNSASSILGETTRNASS